MNADIIIINRRVLIFADFVVHLNHENKTPTIFPLIVACSVRNHEFKNFRNMEFEARNRYDY